MIPFYKIFLSIARKLISRLLRYQERKGEKDAESKRNKIIKKKEGSSFSSRLRRWE